MIDLNVRRGSGATLFYQLKRCEDRDRRER
jgi:hypothetical protein